METIIKIDDDLNDPEFSKLVKENMNIPGTTLLIDGNRMLLALDVSNSDTIFALGALYGVCSMKYTYDKITKTFNKITKTDDKPTIK